MPKQEAELDPREAQSASRQTNESELLSGAAAAAVDDFWVSSDARFRDSVSVLEVAI